MARFILILFLAAPILASAQVDKGIISSDSEIQSEFQSFEKHRYTLELPENQFVLLKVMQQGIDLKVESVDSDGNSIGQFDSPNGSNGPEFVSILSTGAGTYAIEVMPLDHAHVSGSYTVSVIKNEPGGITPDARLDQYFAKYSEETPGAAVAVFKGPELLYARGYGMANLEYGIPITPETIFHIASVSKQFTAFSILLLAQDGKLGMDDDIRKYIPEVPDFGYTITLRHLVHHTSGLRDQWNLLAMAGWRLDDVITTEQVIKMVSRQKDLNFEPGTEFVYCNTGYSLLAEVVARVSGKSFAAFTRERIFDPLGMNSTLFYDNHEKIVPNRAYSYYEGPDGYMKSVLSYATVGATSLFTTVEDLGKWADNFRSHKVGSEETLEKMNERAVLNKVDTLNYAYGQNIGMYRGIRMISHGGADAGYRSFLARFPDQDVSVIVFSNNASFNSYGAATKAADYYLDEYIEKPMQFPGLPQATAAEKEGDEADEEAAEGSATDAEASEEQEASGVLIVDAAVLESYQGTYELQPGFTITVSTENGQLFGQATGQNPLLLIPRSESGFDVDGVEAYVEFIRNDAGEQLLRLTQNGTTRDAPLMAYFDGAAVELEEFTGTYYSPELSTAYEFVIKDGVLTAQHQRHSDISMRPLKDDMFEGGAWFFQTIEFDRDAEGTITGCRVSSGRVRNVVFTKTGK